VVHRDVKPENLLLGRRNEVLLGDFGIAIVARKSHDLSPYNTAGTMPYMTPAQLRRKPCPASDQNSLGIVVYEWLCGMCPFWGSSDLEVAMQHLTHTPQPLCEIDPSIPPTVDQVVRKALAKEPEERYASIQDFAETLERASYSANSTAFAQPLVRIEHITSQGTPTSTSGDSLSTLPASSSNDSLPTADDGI
jgi:serine/threonine protein kinase